MKYAGSCSWSGTALLALLLLLIGCSGEETPNPSTPDILENAPPVAMVRSIVVDPDQSSATVSLDGWDFDGRVTDLKYCTDYNSAEVTVLPSETFTGTNGLTIYTREVSLSGVPAGTHWVRVWSRDDDDEWSVPSTTSFTLDASGDTEPPTTTIISGPSGTIGYSTVTFTWTGADNITATGDLIYRHMLQGYDTGWSLFSSSTSASFLGLADGQYTILVKAYDEAGLSDPTPASRSFHVETTQIEPGFMDVIAQYDLSELADTYDKCGFAVDGDVLWLACDYTLEKRSADDFSLIASYSLPSGMDDGSLGYGFSITAIPGHLLLHAPGSKYYYKISLYNPTVIAESWYFEDDNHILRTPYSFTFVSGVGLYFNRASEVIVTDLSLNILSTTDSPSHNGKTLYQLQSDGHGGFWGTLLDIEGGDLNTFEVVRLDGSLNLLAMYVMPYDSNSTWLDNPLLIGADSDDLWLLVTRLEGVPTLCRHYIGD